MNTKTMTAEQLLDVSTRSSMFAEVQQEILARLEAWDESAKDYNNKMVESFSRCASFAVCSLAGAHRMPRMTKAQIREFTNLLFDFFCRVCQEPQGKKDEPEPFDMIQQVLQEWHGVNLATSARSAASPSPETKP